MFRVQGVLTVWHGLVASFVAHAEDLARSQMRSLDTISGPTSFNVLYLLSHLLNHRFQVQSHVFEPDVSDF